MDIREFKNIYNEFSPSVMWDWCAKPTPEEIDTRLFEFSEMGILRTFIRPSKGLVLPYLSDEYFELIRTAARRAGKYGIRLIICDENAPVSGIGGGEITSVDDYRVRDIIKIKKKDIEKTDEIISEIGEDVIALRDISKVRASGRYPIADITDRFVTECFRDAVYDKYFRECKRFLGVEIEGFLTNFDFPETFIPYSASAIKKAHKDVSEDIITTDKSSYLNAVSECVGENFTTFLKEECSKNELSLSVSIYGEKEFSRQIQYLKADSVSLSIDTENIDYIQLKLAETVSSQYDKPFYVRLQLPAFSPCSKRYNAASFMSAFGAKGIIYDSIAFSLTDRRKYEKHTQALSVFAEKNISERLSRLCFVGANTFSDAKVLVIYNTQYDALYNDIAKILLSNGIPFHVMEKDFFEKNAEVSEKVITAGKCVYDTVIADTFDYTQFRGNFINADDDFSIEEFLPSQRFKIVSDSEVFVNRRMNGEDEYIFVTSFENDVKISAIPEKKNLFVADSSNGEIYRIASRDGKCDFSLKAGKTAVLIYSDKLNEDYAPPYTDDIEFTSHTKKCEVEFALSAAGENILPLKNVNACFGRKAFRENSIDNLHKEFYSLNEGESVKVKYPFNAECESIGEVVVYVENADNIDYAEINGNPIKNFTPSEKDPRFKGADITKFIADGKNIIALGYKKYNNYNPDFSSFTPAHFSSYNVTSFEPVYLCGDFDAEEASLTRFSEYENDVTKSGMAYYYGPLTFVAKLPETDLNGCIFSILGDFDICRIKIGKRTLTFFSETPIAELFNLDCGGVAEITIYNTPRNLLRNSVEEADPFGINSIEICSFDY